MKKLFEVYMLMPKSMYLPVTHGINIKNLWSMGQIQINSSLVYVRASGYWGQFPKRIRETRSKNSKSFTTKYTSFKIFGVEFPSEPSSRTKYLFIHWKIWFYRMFQRLELSHHYSDIIMSVMASQVTSLTIVYSTVCSDEDKKTH